MTEGDFHLGERAMGKSWSYVLSVIHPQQPEAVFAYIRNWASYNWEFSYFWKVILDLLFKKEHWRHFGKEVLAFALS